MRNSIKLLLKFLKKIKSLSVMTFILLVFLVIAAGWYLHWPIVWIVLGVIVVIFVGVVVAIIRKLRSKKGSQSIEKSLKSSAGSGKEAAKQEEIEQLREHLSNAIEALKKSKLGKGVTGQAALHELPWYMFIGPPGAGKTTAIENSGLEFPYGTERIHGVGGTRNCDWFFSNSAIFLDTAGRYTTEEEDRDEWFAFLSMLKKNRKRRPINGVIIGVSITDIISGSVEEIESMAKTIRERIDELTERLGVRYPVYTVFTKCDLITGFVEFFEDLSKTDREQIWGCTFSRSQRENPDVSEVFLSEFQQLHDALLRVRIDRLNSPMNRQTRQRVYTFPVEFLQLKDQLDTFISKLFHPNPYKESPLFRGFYFTSGTQEGVPIDRVIQSIAQQFQLPQETAHSFDPEMEKKSYFIKDLFTEVVVPDQEMVSRTRRAADKYGALKLGVFGAAVILVGLLFIGASSSHFKFKSDSKQLLAAAHSVEKIQWNNESFSQNFNALSSLHQQIEQVGHPSFFTRGIYRGDQIIKPGKQLFYAKLKPFIATYLYDGYLQQELKRYIRGKSGIHREQAYNMLRVYLLMGSEHQRLTNSRVERKFLSTHVSALMDSILQRRFNFAYQAANHNEKLDQTRNVIHSQIAYFVDIFTNPADPKNSIHEITPFQTDQKLVAQTRDALGTPSLTDVYAQIKREAAVETQPLLLSEIVGQKNIRYFAQDERISGFYTKQGFDNYVTNKIRKVSESPGKEDWVLAISTSQLPEEMQNPEEMQKNLIQMYYTDYVNSWRNYLERIRLSGFSSMASAADELKVLGDANDSPMQLLLKKVTEETQFESAIGRSARGIGKHIGIEGSMNPIDQAFSAIHQLTDDDNGDLPKILEQYAAISTVMDGLAKKPESQSATYAATIIQQHSGDFPDALRNIQGALNGVDKKVQNALIIKPVMLSWQLVLGRANTYLNSMWKDQVYNTYQAALASHYPFKKSSTTDAPIADVVQFFNRSNGALWNFVNSQLQPFIRDNAYRTADWEGYGISLSTRLKNALEKASEITRGLNLQSADNLAIRFSLLPNLPAPSGLVDQVVLDIDGSSLLYRMGQPRWTEFTWPGTQGTSSAHLEIQTKHDAYDPIYSNSAWGWFHLLDKAKIIRQTASNYMVQWNLPSSSGGPTVTVKFNLRTGSIYQPFGSSNFFDFSLPSSLN